MDELASHHKCTVVKIARARNLVFFSWQMAICEIDPADRSIDVKRFSFPCDQIYFYCYHSFFREDVIASLCTSS